ncbi:uncharacterized protein Z518_10144 [Rhinocladiella mackenziei CBS 650.93]|uniref:Uncharacterized protein n=1 Tax=Rhinocladiella mackenziei CBS 650.93 TaxID=1442369 RepID=A0A0D2GS07_9EURO|nr:uncharacterized protein Z518_10144 [Rhinocladiella mackenziei CBS 650.93]KIX01078.1 hypothetical protein Z518_10144 [Rhinocladiella mackenziei CBS 650.93]
MDNNRMVTTGAVIVTGSVRGMIVFVIYSTGSREQMRGHRPSSGRKVANASVRQIKEDLHLTPEDIRFVFDINFLGIVLLLHSCGKADDIPVVVHVK